MTAENLIYILFVCSLITGAIGWGYALFYRYLCNRVSEMIKKRLRLVEMLWMEEKLTQKQRSFLNQEMFDLQQYLDKLRF